MTHHRGLVITAVIAVVIGVVAIGVMELATNDTNEAVDDELALESRSFGLTTTDNYGLLLFRNNGRSKSISGELSSPRRCLQTYNHLGPLVYDQDARVYFQWISGCGLWEVTWQLSSSDVEDPKGTMHAYDDRTKVFPEGFRIECDGDFECNFDRDSHVFVHVK
jgi:hypothetical protein